MNADSSDGSLILSAVRQTLRDVRQAAEPNILGIGLGVGLKNDKIDLERPLCLRFFVKEKHTKKSKELKKQKFKIDRDLKLSVSSLRLGGKSLDALSRSVRRGNLELPTDVHQVALTPASGKTSLGGSIRFVTSGLIVRWSQAGNATPLWGVLTVGHEFHTPVSIFSPSEISILIPGSTPFFGRRIVNFYPPRSGVDASLITVDVADLLSRGLISRPDESSYPVVPFDQVKTDRFLVGSSIQIDREVGFQVLTTVAWVDVDTLGSIKNMLHVRGAPNAFVEGTSGSLFQVTDSRTRVSMPLAIQVGADKSNYADGYGQSLDTALVTVKIALNEVYTPGFVNGEIELIRAF